MGKYKLVLVGIIAALLTFFTVQILLRTSEKLFLSDFFISVPPGWHTTISPNNLVETGFVLILSLIVYLIFKLMRWLVSKVFSLF
jgi:hypothetical protein